MTTAEPPQPAASSSAPYVFVSYASRDRDRVLPVVEALEAAGIGVWLDRHAIPGFALYGSRIVAGIEGCAGLLLACSDAAFASRHVRQEVSLAGKYDRPVLPLMLERTTIPRDLEYTLAGWQRVDVLDRPAESWLPAVLGAVRRLVNDDGLGADTPPPAPRRHIHGRPWISRPRPLA